MPSGVFYFMQCTRPLTISQFAEYSLSVATTTMSLNFWKPGTAAPGSSLDRASQLEDAFVPTIPVQGRLPILNHRMYFLSSPDNN